MTSPLDPRTVMHALGAVLVALLLTPVAPRSAAAQDAAAMTSARLHFEAGQSEYAAGRFEEALVDFRAAYATTSAPEILFNIATVLDRLRRDTEAADAYERYLAAVPSSPDRQNLTARIAVLRAARAAGEAAPDPTPVANAPSTPEVAPTPAIVEPPRDAPPAAASASPAGWIVFGIGLAVAVGGGVLLGVAEMDAASVRDATFFPDVRSAHDRVPIESGLGWSALAVGVAAAGVGLVLALTSGSGGRGDARAVIGPGSVSVRVTL